MSLILQHGRPQDFADIFAGAGRMSLKTVLTTVVAGSQYLIHPQILGTIQETINPDVIIPVTVLESEQLYKHLEETLRLFAFYDDVFVPEFGNVLIEKPDPSSAVAEASSVSHDLRSVLHLHNNSARINKRDVADIPAGPYILHGPNLHQAWKVYNDTLDAFAFGVYPDDDNAYEVLEVPGNGHTSIPVPSRLYSNVARENAPLSGYRFTIPDSVSLKGTPTTLSSSAWTDVYNGTADSTAAFAQRLVDLGAVIVGKTKSSQFGSGREWTDVLAPKNPREDGHQDPEGGSTGAASALADYNWLKGSTGLDAIGQVFEPAAAQGLFALRTSHGLLSLSGAVTSSSSFDSIGILGYDVSELFHDAVAVVHKSLSSPPIIFPRRIIFIKDLGSSHNKNKHKHKQFVAAVEAFVGVNAEIISLEREWEMRPPAEANRQSLHGYMKHAPFRSFCYEFYHRFDDFRNVYRTKFGREPTKETTVQYRWELGSKVTKPEYENYQSRISVFRRWFNDKIMPIEDSKGDTILIMPYPSDAPLYDAPKPGEVEGVTAQLLASILQTPQVLAPFAQFSYESKVSHQTEHHAIFGTVLGPKGSDTMLVKLVEATFQQAQWRTQVDQGRFVFPPAQNAQEVNDATTRGRRLILEDARRQTEDVS